MAKGFLALVVASVFLLVLVSSAAKISHRPPDFSYQPLVAAHLQEKAITRAFFDAVSAAAGNALAASQANSAGAGAPAAVKAAVYLAALDFEAQARAQGYDVAFWCGKPAEAALQDASGKMAKQGAVAGNAREWRAVVPEGALPLSNPACAMAFDANLLKGKVRASGVGFSLYSERAGIGHAALLPDGIEGDIDG